MPRITLKYVLFEVHPSGTDYRLPELDRILFLSVLVSFILLVLVGIYMLALGLSFLLEEKPHPLAASTFLWQFIPYVMAVSGWLAICKAVRHMQTFRHLPPEAFRTSS